MDENKIIRLILEARDNISGPLKNMRANVKKDFDEIDKSFVKSRKGVNLYEEEFVDMTDRVAKGTKDVDRATASVNKLTSALRSARVEAQKGGGTVTGFVQDIKGEVRGRRTIRGEGGRILPGGGINAGDRVEVNIATKKAVLINRQLNDALAIGYNFAKNTQKVLDGILGATKEIRKERLKEAEEVLVRNLDNVTERQNKERALQAELVEEKVRQSGLLEIREDALVAFHNSQKKFAETQNEDDLRATQRLENEYNFIGKRIEAITGIVSNERTERFKKERIELNKNFQLEKNNIKNLSKEDALRAIEDVKNKRKAVLESGTKRDKAAKRVGFAAADFFGGIGRGRSQARDLDKDLEKLASTFGRLGFAIGNAFKDMNSFVNLRWLFITSVITLLINLLTQLVVVLVSVASSAILAASALGAGLAAGVAQAIPVIGLLVGAFSELGKAMDAVKLANKADLTGADAQKEVADKKAQVLQRLADAHYTVKKAIESVSDAQYNLNQSNKDVAKAYADQKSAIVDLAEARKQAAQDIIDANLQEKDSALALEEAELAVLTAKEKLRKEEEKKRRGGEDVSGAQAALKEAQDRLALARSQGDDSEILRANQQLSIAQQNLNDVQDSAAESRTDLKDAQLGVERAEINRQQAANKKRRDAQEAQTLRKKGISQSDQVVAAEKQLAAATQGIADAQHNVVQSQRSLTDAIHSLAVARREENDSKKALLDTTNLQSTAQKNLNNAIADFSPAQKGLFNALIKVRDAYKKAFVGGKGKDGILAPILEGFTSIADVITKLLTDPEVLSAFSRLSKGIGAGIKVLAGVFGSKAFKDDILFFISEATDNLPKVFNIFKNILQIVRDISRAGAPIFKDLLGGLDSLVGRAAKFTGAKGPVNPANRKDGNKGPAVSREELSPLEAFLGNASKHLDAWLKLAKAITSVIQALVNVSAPTGKGLVESATDALVKLANYINENPEEVAKFFNEIADSFKVLASALLGLIIIFGKAAKNENIQNFAIFLIDVIVPGIYLMIVAVGAFAGALDQLTKIPILGWFIKWGVRILIAEKALNKLFPITQGLTNLIRNSLAKALGYLYFAITKPQLALVLFRNTLQSTIVKLGVLRSGLLALATRVLPLLGTAFYAALGPVGLIIIAIAAVGTAIYLLDKKFHFIRPTINFFWKLMKSVFDWIKNHWRLVTALLTGPIGVAVLLIIKHWDKVKAIFTGLKDFLIKYYFSPVYNALIKPFVEASKFIIGIFEALPELIVKAMKGLGGLVGKVLDKIPGFRWAQDKGIIPKFGKTVKQVGGVLGGAKSAVVGAAKGVGSGTDSAEVFLGGDPKPDKKEEKKKTPASEILDKDLPFHGKLIRRLRGEGLSDVQILRRLIKNKILLRKNFKKRFGVALGEVQGFGGGSSGVPGRGTGDTVPAMLTPGEWVLNNKQIRRVASAMGVSVQQAKAQIFGTNMTGNPGVRGTAGMKGMKPSKLHSPFIGGSFTLIPQEDDSGETVWFIQLADGTFGQVTDKDATKIQNTNGKYIPGYVRRNSHGFSQRISTEMNPLGYRNGGIIPQAVRGFAEGGVVQSPGFGNTTNSGATVNQNFNVKTEGSTDWAYVMRLSSITAQSAF